MQNTGLEEVFLANRPALERFLRARCGNAAEAEDLVQELWLKLAAATGTVVEPLAYLYRMADNLVLDKRRSAKRRVRRDDAWSDLSGGGALGISDAPSAERHIIAASELRRVEKALYDLGDRTFTIFKRFRIDGVHQREIAVENNISVSAVEKHLQKSYRALLQYREKIDADSRQAERLVLSKGDEGTNA